MSFIWKARKSQIQRRTKRRVEYGENLPGELAPAHLLLCRQGVEALNLCGARLEDCLVLEGTVFHPYLSVSSSFRLPAYHRPPLGPC